MWYHAIYKEANEFNKSLGKGNYEVVLDNIINVCNVMKSYRETPITRRANTVIKRCNKLKENIENVEDCQIDKTIDLMYNIADDFRIWIDCFGSKKENY